MPRKIDWEYYKKVYDFLQNHTYKETADQFETSETQIARIKKRYEKEQGSHNKGTYYIGNNFLEHPSKDITGSLTSLLSGKTICLCVTGSVAAVNSPALARKLMRNGAEVYTVMTEAATKLIHPDLLHWSTGNEVITSLTGNIEHIMLAGERPGKYGKADLIVIAPATANTVSKIACGIDDTPVTTVATTALGSGTPMMIVPAMHESMYRHPILEENMKKLMKLDIDLILPKITENKAKIAPTDYIVDRIISKLIGNDDLKNMKFLVTAGPCREFIDRVRFISNPSSGRMGIEIANEIIHRSGEVTVILGKSGSAIPPHGMDVRMADSADDFLNETLNALKETEYDVCISAAAIADYTPIRKVEDKIASKKDALTINLKTTPKLIDNIRKHFKEIYLVAFKAETNLSEDDMIKKSYERMKDARANMIVANYVYGSNKTGFQCATNEVYIITDDHGKPSVHHVKLCSKREVAQKLINNILNQLKA